MPDYILTKCAVSVTEMARMVGLSRARFYQLMESGVFPRPDHDALTGRPFYSEPQQLICLEVRRRNCGADGKPILFYARRSKEAAHAPPIRRAKAAPGAEIVALLNGVKALGATTATMREVTAAIADLYPDGTSETDQEQVLRAVFLRLHR